MPLILDHPRLPPAGHTFTDSTGVVFLAKSIPELIKSVQSYRSNNALPAGSPSREVEEYYAANFPWLISKVGETPADPKDELLREWINRLWRNPPKQDQWMDSENAKSRQRRCDLCPGRTEAGIVSDVYLRRLIILGGGRISGSKSHCLVHKWDCGLASWIETPPTAETEPFPGCWLGEIGTPLKSP